MSAIGEAINKHYEAAEREKLPRGHLGASGLGKPCMREIWYAHRWAQTNIFDGRMLRLFQRGHREEPFIFDDLRAIGVQIFDVDEAGKQYGIKPAAKGHMRGSIDAVAIGLPGAPDPDEPVLLDIKTTTEKKLARIEKYGFEMECQTYFGQGTLYMGGLDLKRACYLFVAKDTDRIHEEWFDFNPEYHATLIEKAERIIASDTPPAKAWDSPHDFGCKWCDYKSLCHQRGDTATVTCRSCIHATPVEDGEWHCAAWDRLLTREEQWQACDSHIFIPQLVTFGVPKLSGGNPTDHDCWIEYQKVNGARFRNVVRDANGSKIAGHYSSRELTAGWEFIGDTGLDLLRETFDAEIVPDA